MLFSCAKSAGCWSFRFEEAFVELTLEFSLVTLDWNEAGEVLLVLCFCRLECCWLDCCCPPDARRGIGAKSDERLDDFDETVVGDDGDDDDLDDDAELGDFS